LGLLGGLQRNNRGRKYNTFYLCWYLWVCFYCGNSGNAGVNKDHVLINDLWVVTGESSDEPSVEEKKGAFIQLWFLWSIIKLLFSGFVIYWNFWIDGIRIMKSLIFEFELEGSTPPLSKKPLNFGNLKSPIEFQEFQLDANMLHLIPSAQQDNQDPSTTLHFYP
jgi:hypothetical protein